MSCHLLCSDNATQHGASIGEGSQMYSTKTVTVLVLGLMAASAMTLEAQNNASINVTAAVQQPITATAANPLDFGAVFPGVPQGVRRGSGTAGPFTCAGQAGA